MNTKNLQPKDYEKLKIVKEIDVSEKYVAWVEKGVNKETKEYNSHIKILTRENGKIIKFTAGNSDSTPIISPDETKLAFVSKRNEKKQLFLMEFTGGEAQPLTLEKYSVMKYDWSPDSTKIVFSAKIPKSQELDEEWEELENDPRVISNMVYQAGTEYVQEELVIQLFTIDLKTGKIELLTDKEYNFYRPKWYDNETILAVTILDEPKDNSDYKQVVKIDLATKEMKRFAEIYNPFYFMNFSIELTPDKSIFMGKLFENTYSSAFLSQIGKWGKISEGKVEIINKELDRSINTMKWYTNEKALCLVSNSGKNDLRIYDRSTGEFNQLFEPRNSIEGFGGTEEEVYFIGIETIYPSAVWKWSKEKGIELVTDPNEELIKAKKITLPEEIWLTNEEGVKYQGWFFDASTEEKKAPLILSMHGGPHVMWDSAAMWFEWQTQVAEGYSVLAMNPVGSDGYGEEFLRVICGNWGKVDARDLLAAIDYLAEQGKIDTENLFIGGGSYAGFQTANIIGIDHRFKAACAQRGVFNLSSLDAGGDIVRFDELWYLDTEEKDVLKLWNDSPISKVKEVNTPLLIIHSEQDYRVPIHQADHYFTELKRHNKEVLFVRYPREGHELSRSGEPKHIIDRLERIINWFNKYKQ
jgi:dipeptidyl aminopeptidase/acylaminoacyl peptidase